MRDPTCHRCGARAPRGPSRRSICARCASAPARASVPELDELATLPTPRDERISFGLIEGFDASLAAPVLDTRPRPPWRGLAIVLLLGLSLGGLGTITVQQVTATEAKPGVALVLDAKAVGPVAPAVQPEVAEPEVASPTVEPAAPAAPEPAAPEPTPRPRRASTSRPAATPEPAPVAEPTPAPAPRPSIAELPTRQVVRAAFIRIHDDVQQCGDVEQIGTTVIARVTFSGETGRVRYAEVVDASVPPDVRSCVARVARAAQVEPFAREDLRVDYPFRL
ncbi:MAG: hypothetical protein H6719_17545 [Sandaracinaceae bacterium]|nr:hypothetical protein [Sandaracinaceae bacterium]